jgi:hypothetical protein
LLDMGKKPTPQHSIDRLDVNGNYTPENSRWADAITQATNRRVARFHEFLGERKTAPQWERDLNLPSGVVGGRIRKGWSVEDALTRPIRKTSATRIRK